MQTHWRRTLVVSIVSGIICGLFFVVTTFFVGYRLSFTGSGHVLKLRPGELDLSNWTLWIPGAVFGFVFAIANMGLKLRTWLFTVASCLTYVVAVHLFGWILNFGPPELSSLRLPVGGLLAGLFGALSLAVTLSRFVRTPVPDVVRTAIVGGIAGAVFVSIMWSPTLWPGGDPAFVFSLVFLAWPFAFAIWQASVGWSLAAGLQRPSVVSRVSAA